MTPGKKPNHSSSQPQLVNPYAATLADEPCAARVLSEPEAVTRKFRIRMDWADRRRFMRVVGLMRFAAVAGAVLGFLGLYSMANGAYGSWMGGLATWGEPLIVVRWLFVMAKAGLGFYACWLQWIFADAVAAAAGGRTNEMHEWSVIQLRIAWLVVVTLLLNMASVGWDWLSIQLMSKAPFGL